MTKNPFAFPGLNDAEVAASGKLYGRNAFNHTQKSIFWPALRDTLTEPMFILLLVAATLYFLLGELSEAIFMLGAILVVSAISFYQDSRSRKALIALKGYTESRAKVIRNNEICSIASEEIVVGDLVVVEEGTLLPADGEILHSNDFAVNESIVTGEAFSINKNAQDPEMKEVFQGTQAVSGLAVFRVTRIGVNTVLGKIGKSLETIQGEKTPLQLQIENFVKKMAALGAIVFIGVWGLNYYASQDIPDSLLKGLTLAMSILPEEIPVAFTTFMALGAWRLMKVGIIVKRTRTVETLGSATVLCLDKTGTITENRMELVRIYVHETGEILDHNQWNTRGGRQLITTAMWASEPVPFDPMEIALHTAYQQITAQDQRRDFSMIHEYPLSGKPPMMTHIFQSNQGQRIIASKGAPESLLDHSTLSQEEREVVADRADAFSREGFRVLGVAQAVHEDQAFPSAQQDFEFRFIGLIAFLDPPKKNIEKVFHAFYQAGLKIKILTGDNAITTSAIARRIGFKGSDHSISGQELISMTDEILTKEIESTDIFTRMFPEAKVRIIESLKRQNQIVAMTGDGVNDGPALKAAHIGIAMGKRGSELAKEAAELVLTDDDLGKMVDAIAMGRKIYNNLKKAIQYIISIHIPIILTVALPLMLGWAYPNIFTPVHVIFLELIMGPTCSIVYENEPIESRLMRQPPRPLTNTFLTWRELSISVSQGLVITAVVLGIYWYGKETTGSEDATRAMVFSTLVSANIFLTIVNRSFYDSLFRVLRYKNGMLVWMLSITFAMLLAVLFVTPVSSFFSLQKLSGGQFGLCLAAGFCSVIWFEIYKALKRSGSI
jgi:P-type Ca2+ transporter type 2C